MTGCGYCHGPGPDYCSRWDIGMSGYCDDVDGIRFHWHTSGFGYSYYAYYFFKVGEQDFPSDDWDDYDYYASHYGRYYEYYVEEDDSMANEDFCDNDRLAYIWFTYGDEGPPLPDFYEYCFYI
jgi:hypothetical protein